MKKKKKKNFTQNFFFVSLILKTLRKNRTSPNNVTIKKFLTQKLLGMHTIPHSIFPNYCSFESLPK